MTSGGKKAKVFPRQSTLSHDHPLAKQFPVSDHASDPAIVAQTRLKIPGESIKPTVVVKR